MHKLFTTETTAILVGENENVLFVCPSVGNKISPPHVKTISILFGVVEWEKRIISNDTTRDIGTPLPEIVALIASLAPNIIGLLSNIKGGSSKKIEAIREVVASDKTDAEVRMLIAEILKL